MFAGQGRNTILTPDDNQYASPRGHIIKTFFVSRRDVTVAWTSSSVALRCRHRTDFVYKMEKIITAGAVDTSLHWEPMMMLRFRTSDDITILSCPIWSSEDPTFFNLWECTLRRVPAPVLIPVAHHSLIDLVDRWYHQNIMCWTRSCKYKSNHVRAIPLSANRAYTYTLTYLS